MEFLVYLLDGIVIGLIGIYIADHLTIQKQYQAMTSFNKDYKKGMLQKRLLVFWWYDHHILTLSLWKEYVK
jgi:hypothetical protein